MQPAGLHGLRAHALAAPQREALVCADRIWRYGELEALANRYAQVLRGLGLSRGDHVAACLGNRAEMLALAWAAWRSGVYLTPMATTLVASELAYLVTDCGARAVFADADLAEAAAALPGACTREGMRWLSVGGPVAGYEPVEPLLQAAPEGPIADECPGALMMYTSGTTGAPKGVIRPLLPPDWQGMPPFAADLITLFGVGGTHVRYLSTSPLYHAAPLRFALAVTAGGGTAWVMPRFDAREALHLLKTQRITHSLWVPAMFQRLLALPEAQRQTFRAPDHQCAIHGAAPCPPALKQAMIGWWGPVLLEYYSGTEGIGLTRIDSHEALRKPGSVGRCAKGRLHVVDDAGREVGPGVTGRIYFSGLPPFAYHGAADKTATRSLPGGLQTFGDIGHVDSDGYLYLTDRQDDMIISGGVNVYPQEIENVLRDVSGVWDCAVVGMPDERFGETPVAFIECERDTDEALLRQRLQAACEQRLGRNKRPGRIEFVEALPRSATGKLLRRQLREGLPAPAHVRPTLDPS